MSVARSLLVALAAVVAVVVVGLVVVASIDQRALTERVANRVVAAASESLGREVTIEGARGRLLPDPRVTITGLSVAGRPGEPALVTAEEVRVQLRTWPILRSLGREIVIDSVVASRPEVHLVRDAEGAWNFEGLGGERGESRSEVTFSRLSMEDGTVRVIDRGAPGEGETSVALTVLDVEAELPAAGPARMTLRGAFASDAQNLTADLTIAPPSEAPARVNGTVELRGAELARLGGLVPAGISRVVRGGRADVQVAIDTADDGEYELRGEARLVGVRLRGEPAAGSLRFSARVDPESPAAFRARIQHASLRGPGIELAGSGAVSGQPRSVTFDVRGPLVDLDVLLAALPERERPAEDEDRAVLPPSLRRSLEETGARGTLHVDRVVRGRLALHDLTARAELRGGVLELEEASAGIYGGRLVASGTTVDLRPATPAWTLAARLEGVELGAMMSEVAGDRALVGTLGAAVDATGAGADWTEVRSNVRGSGAVQLRDGVLTTGDLGGQAASVVGQALRLAGRDEARVLGATGGRTELGDLRVTFRIEGGHVVLTQPLSIDAPFGAARLDGRIGLDRSLDLTGTISLSPDFVESVASVRPAGPIEVPLTIGGTLQSPSISLPPPERLVSSIARSAVREGARALERELGEEIEERVGEDVRDLWRRLPLPGL